MKSNKTGCFVLIAFASAFIIVSAVMSILQPPASPVNVSSTPIVVKSDESPLGNVKLEFWLENVSDRDVTITSFEFTVKTDNETEQVKDDTNVIALKAGEEKRLNFEYQSDNNPEDLTKIVVKINGKEYIAFGMKPAYKGIGMLFGFLALLLDVLAVVCFIILLNKDKRYAAIEREIQARFAGNALFVIGKYGKKGEAGKAVAKSTASFLGGALSALFLGFGVYRVYGAHEMKEFVVTDDRLYVGNPVRKGFNLDSMSYMPRGTFLESEVVAKKKTVTLRNKASGEFFAFNLSGSKTVTVEQLVNKLNTLLTPIENVAQDDAAVGNDETTANNNQGNQGDDPIDI